MSNFWKKNQLNAYKKATKIPFLVQSPIFYLLFQKITFSKSLAGLFSSRTPHTSLILRWHKGRPTHSMREEETWKWKKYTILSTTSSSTNRYLQNFFVSMTFHNFFSFSRMPIPEGFTHTGILYVVHENFQYVIKELFIWPAAFHQVCNTCY